jgi:cellulose biosynthesis protein BcsQ
MAQYVVFYANKGGVGKSTLSFCLACVATCGGPALRVLLVGCDPQGDSIRWALRGKLLESGRVKGSPYRFDVLFLPGGFSVGAINESQYDLVIVDLPPFVESIRSIRPKLWCVPIKDGPSLTNTMPALSNMKAQGGQVVFIPNGFCGGKREQNQLMVSLRSVRAANVMEPIPYKPTIGRVATYGAPPWAVPHGYKNGKPSSGARAMLKACGALVRLLNGYRSFSSSSVLPQYYPPTQKNQKSR